MLFLFFLFLLLDLGAGATGDSGSSDAAASGDSGSSDAAVSTAGATVFLLRRGLATIAFCLVYVVSQYVI